MADNAYGLPDGTPAYTPQPLNAGMQMPQANPYTPPQQLTPQPGMFDSVPFHSWLAKNKTNPWDLSDEDIKKSVDDYANGPLKTIIAHHYATTKGMGSDKALQDRVTNDTNYYKMLAQQQVEDNLPAIKQHLRSLKPAGAPAAPQEPGDLANLGYGALRGASTAARGLSMAGAGAVGALPFVPESVKQQAQDILFKGADKLKNYESTIPQAQSTLGQVEQGVGAFVPGIATAGAGAAGAAGQDVLRKGGGLGSAEAELTLNAVTNMLGLKIGSLGPTVAKKVLAGAASGLGLNELARVAHNEINPNDQQAFDPVSAGLAAGAGAVAGRLHNEPAKLGTPVEGTGQPNPAATAANDRVPPAPNAEADALAAQATGENSQNAAPTAQALAPEHQARINDAVGDVFDTPGEGKTPQERFDSKPVQDILSTITKDAPPEQVGPITEAFKNNWAKAHDVNPDEILTKTPPSAEAAPQSVEGAVAPAEQPNVEQLLAHPITTQVRGTNGKVTNKSVPVEFQNPVDQLAYLYKHGDEETRPLIADELVKRGVPTEKIQEVADKVDKDVSGSVNSLKHKVTISDRGLTTKPEVVAPLRKPRAPKT